MGVRVRQKVKGKDNSWGVLNQPAYPFPERKVKHTSPYFKKRN